MRAIRRASRLDVTPGTIGICQNGSHQRRAWWSDRVKMKAQWRARRGTTRRRNTHSAREKLEARVEIEVSCLEKVAASGFAGKHDDGGL